jgi:steroid delta-isomerase-like uncharacterized protein
MRLRNLIFLSLICLSVATACNDNAAEANNVIGDAASPNQQLVQQYFDLFNQHDWEKLYDMYSSNAAFKDPAMGPGHHQLSKEEFVKKYNELAQMFPDLKDEVKNIYPSKQNVVVVEFVSTGKSEGGMQLELPICTIFEFENGKITKDFTYYNNEE